MDSMLVLLACLIAGVSASSFHIAPELDGAKVIKCELITSKSRDAVRQMAEAGVVSLWAEHVDEKNLVADMMVPKRFLQPVQQFIDANDGICQPQMADVKEMIIDEWISNERAKKSTKSIVGTYARYADILSWQEDMCSTYSSLASCIEIGKSYEGRTMKVIRIGSSGGASKPALFFDAGIHAREWISPATMIWIFDKLLTSYATDAEAKEMLDSYDWYLLPSSNPDGYEYTHTTNRNWRKTRSPNSGSTCTGTDPNRNFDYVWATVGSSGQPCSDTYHGKSAFSEKETQNIRDFLVNSDTVNWMAAISVHSYSQFWMLPWSGDPVKPADYDDLYAMGDAGTKALVAVNNKVWRLGNIVELLYPVGGGSIDWYKAVRGIKYSEALELRPKSGSFNGFVVNAREIPDSGKELYAGLVAAFRKMTEIESMRRQQH